MRILKKIILSLLGMINACVLFAQDNKTAMADTMRSNGRIYVVVAVVITILVGLILYMVRVDRKLSKLEKDN
jgi:predicted tellurium resistance membrane protein TerC